eukprot:Gregarina_sp_Poly_1__7867@NODE_446_length_8330_cov_67_406269_g364_i0_p1_GENE_NODE_446_length_8330_cov_67_406269_g364_i0NODE_446_length_8330_cov_67_406269_g364_i0_p1_ORF_typecomplete_len1023_score141_55Hydrolase/PF00702_26/2_7e05COX15CtaA/PF02628_15/0_058_NODE_446_length_8330_cov_67_406269_g364_i035906658
MTLSPPQDTQEEGMSLRPYTLPIITTEKDAGFHQSQSESSHYLACPVEWKSQDSARGLRFVDNAEGLRFLPILRPFSLAMKMTQVPPVYRVQGISVAWLHTWRLHDFFQRDFFDVDDWQECLCGLTKLTDMTTSINRFKAVRHVLAVDSTRDGDEQHCQVPVTGTASRAQSQIIGGKCCMNEVKSSQLFTPTICAAAPGVVEGTPVSVMTSSETLQTISTEAQHITIQDSPFFVDYLNFSDRRNLHVTMLSLAKDSDTNKVHLFSKSRPEALIAKCRSCFDGKNIRQMNQKLGDKLEAVLMQWRSQGFDIFGFGYAPLTQAQQMYLLHTLEEHTVVTTCPKKRLYASFGSGTVRRHAEGFKRRMVGNPYGASDRTATSQLWKPLVSLPGPRSVTLRPEPFVCSESILSTQPIWNECHEISDSTCPPETSLSAACIDRGESLAPTCDGSEVLRLINYDNTLVAMKVRTGEKRVDSRMSDTARDSNRHVQICAEAAPESSSTRDLSETSFELQWKASWLPIKMASLGAETLRRIWEENMIFLGLTAIKNITPEDVPERIADFHAAGVRVSIFSRLPLKQTRTLGSILGLETGWNSLISLEESDKEAVYINQDGNEVLPAGVPNIKKHLKEVDDIPLLVSLYANSTSPTTREMIRILEANGEIVTCVGSALRTSNFDLFTEASCPVSILLLPYPLCNDCHSRRNIGEYYNPILLPELSFSAALTSLPCALQSHAVSFQLPVLGTSQTSSSTDEDGDEPYPSFLMQLLYSLFQEARRLVAAIELVVSFFVICSAGVIGSILVLQNLLAFPNLLSPYTLTSLHFLLLPWPSIALAFNPVRESAMVEFPRTVSPEMKARRIRRRLNDPKSAGDAPPLATGNTSSRSSEVNSLEYQAEPSTSESLMSLPPMSACGKVFVPVFSTMFLGTWHLGHGCKAAATRMKLAWNFRPEFVEVLERSCLSNSVSQWFSGMWSKCVFDLGIMELEGPSKPIAYEATTGASLLRQVQCVTMILCLLHCCVLSLTYVDR